jgi:uncharacterized lipoprotein YehR (DUF1307 family)
MTMRKKIAIIGVVLISLLLTACGGEEQTVKATQTINGIELELEYIAEGDRVKRQTAYNIMPYDAMGVTNAEEAEALLGETAAEFEGVNGLTHEIDYQDDQVVETLEVDFDEADIEELSTIPGMTFTEDAGNGISLEESIKLLEEQGFDVEE